jgi:hypothetical protein
MQRRALFTAPLLALVLLAAACGGGDDGDTASSDTEAEAATTTTEAATPANPSGTYYVVRWRESSDNPPESEPTGLTTLRVWSLEPDCDDDEPCDLTLTGGGEDGSYDPEGFPEADPLPDLTLEYDEDAETWSAEEELGPYGNCRTADNEYLAGDYTTTDEVDRTELSWDDDGRLVGTKTETYTLNDAGQANPECSPDSDEVVTNRFVAIPEDEFEAEVDDEVELADDYRQSQEVYALEGIDSIQVYDWRVNNEDTEGDGSCGPDECDATLTPAGADDSPDVLELELDDGDLAASFEGVSSCSSEASIDAGGEPEILTEEGYQVTWDLEMTRVVVDDDVPPILIGHGDRVADPLPEATQQFPDDCNTTETLGAYWYFLPTELVS